MSGKHAECDLRSHAGQTIDQNILLVLQLLDP